MMSSSRKKTSWLITSPQYSSIQRVHLLQGTRNFAVLWKCSTSAFRC